MNGNVAAHLLYERCGFVVETDRQAAADDPYRDQLRIAIQLID
jgi:hypothetical protein